MVVPCEVATALNTHALTKLWRALKNRMNVKTSSNHKEFSHEQQQQKKKCKNNEKYIQQLLTAIPIDTFHGPARNIMNALGISSKIIDGLLASKETREKLLLEFVKNRVTTTQVS